MEGISSTHLSSGYWQITVEELDPEKAAFITLGDLYEFQAFLSNCICASHVRAIIARFL